MEGNPNDDTSFGPRKNGNIPDTTRATLPDTRQIVGPRREIISSPSRPVLIDTNNVPRITAAISDATSGKMMVTESHTVGLMNS
jgi:hypothetical protein